ncbi:EXOS9 protein, partial [Atlantisia rogersi]|nr:EXOS9 protein [Atlantisia rogersi]
QVLRCSKITAVKVTEITELIQKALENDQKVRKEGGKFGFAESIPDRRITAFRAGSAAVDTHDVEEQAEGIIAQADPPADVFATAILHTPGTAQIGEGIQNSWGDLEESEKEEAAEEEGESEATALEKIETEDADTMRETKKDEPIVLSDSEEEEVVILEPQELPRKTR